VSGAYVPQPKPSEQVARRATVRGWFTAGRLISRGLRREIGDSAWSRGFDVTFETESAGLFDVTVRYELFGKDRAEVEEFAICLNEVLQGMVSA
jgi:hypothetical protein